MFFKKKIVVVLSLKSQLAPNHSQVVFQNLAKTLQILVNVASTVRLPYSNCLIPRPLCVVK